MSCRTDLEFITKMVDKGAIDRLKKVASTPFERCTYTRAIEVLEEAVKGGKKFEFPVCIAPLTQGVHALLEKCRMTSSLKIALMRHTPIRGCAHRCTAPDAHIRPLHNAAPQICPCLTYLQAFLFQHRQSHSSEAFQQHHYETRHHGVC